MVFADAVVKEARTFIDTKWVHTARVKGHGIDCLGLAILSYNASGANIQDNPKYTMHDEFAKLIRGIHGEFKRIKGFENMLKADVILFREPGQMYNHIGIFTGEKDPFGRSTFIHACAFTCYRKVLEEPYNGYWKWLTLGVYRHKEIVY